MSESNELHTITTLDEQPFKHFCVTIGELPTSFIDSMSYYELAAWLCQYLESTVIPAVNENGAAVTELQNLYIELHNYVENYFNNLDVQDEINNKIDAMVEDGSFQVILNSYVQPKLDALDRTLNNKIDSDVATLQSQIDGLASGSPLVASSTSEMTDTSKIYVNTSDGKWYYYDGDSWEIGGTYQSAEDSGVVNYLDANALVKTSYNKFDYTKSAIGYLINADGTLSVSADYNTSDYIFVEANKQILIKGKLRRFNGFTLDKNVIDDTYVNTSTTDYTYTPTNDSYIRFSYEASSNIPQVVIAADFVDKKEPYKPYIKNDVELNSKELKQIDDKFYLSYLLQNFNKNFTQISLTFEEDYFYQINLTKSFSSNINCATYTIDNSNINNIFKIEGASYSAVKPFIFADENDIVIETQPLSNTTQTGIEYIFIPPKTGTLYINSRNASPTKLYQLSSVTPVLENRDILNGKKYVALGDSFTAGAFQDSPQEDYYIESGIYAGQYKVYPYLIGNRCNMVVENMAVSGMSLAQYGTASNVMSKDDGVYTQIPEDADYITIKIGINDSGHDVPVGDINDDTNTTFYGAWNKILPYIIEHHPNAKIGLIITNGIQTHSNFAEAAINIAKKYGLAYLDEATDYHVPLLIRTNKNLVDPAIVEMRKQEWYVNTSEQTPNWHPNAKCHEYESTIVENFLRTL